MWTKIEEKNALKDEYCKQQFNEAFDEARDVLIDYDLYSEGLVGSILNKIKSGLQKVCPSPEKIKDFMTKYAKRIDAKLSNCKEKWFVDAWNSLKGLVQNMDSQKANESFALYLESIGEDLENLERNQDYIVESLYDEGFMDRLKAGWNAFKDASNDGRGNDAKGDKKNDGLNGKKQGAKKSGVKQQANQKPSLLQQIIQQNGWNKRQALKPENIKIIAARLKKKKDAIPAMIEKYFKNPPKQDAQPNRKNTNAMFGNDGKKGGGGGKGRILQFLKKHWKMIAIILIAAIAFMWAGPVVGARFLVGPTIRQACRLIGGAKGGVLGTVAGIAGTAAVMSMGGDGDVDAGDVDSGDVDVDADDVDADDTDVDDSDDSSSGDDDLSGAGNDLMDRNGNREWFNSMDSDKQATLSKMFRDDPKMIANNGTAGFNWGGHSGLMSKSGDTYWVNIAGIPQHFDANGNPLDSDGNILDIQKYMNKLADSDISHGVLKANLFATSCNAMKYALKTGAAQLLP